MPKLVTDLEKQRKKDLMFEAVITLIKNKSIRKITIEDITNFSGNSKGSFYMYYKSREELIYEVLKHCETSMFNSMIALRNEKCDKREKIKKALHSIYLAKDSIVLYISESDYKNLISKFPNDIYEKEKKKSVNYFEQAMEFFEIDPGKLDMNVLAQLMDSLVFIANNHENHYAEGRKMALEIIIDAIADYMVK